MTSLFNRMETYASRFDSAGKPQHAEVIRRWIEEMKGAGPRQTSARPGTSNADEWQLWLQDHIGLQDETGSGCAFLAVQIVEAIEEHQKALAREVYGLAEDTAAKYGATDKRDDVMGSFSRGRITEAKSIARAVNAIMPYSRDPSALAFGGRERLATRYAGLSIFLREDGEDVITHIKAPSGMGAANAVEAARRLHRALGEEIERATTCPAHTLGDSS